MAKYLWKNWMSRTVAGGVLVEIVEELQLQLSPKLVHNVRRCTKKMDH